MAAGEKQVEIAKDMLRDDLSIESIIMYTNLTRKEIEQLKDAKKN